MTPGMMSSPQSQGSSDVSQPILSAISVPLPPSAHTEDDEKEGDHVVLGLLPQQMANNHHDHNNNNHHHHNNKNEIEEMAELELEELHFGEAAATASHVRGDPTSSTTTSTTITTTVPHVRFPVACKAILLALEGNSRCVDCGASHPEWAAVSYGAMVCLHCAGTHRSLGVNVSTVRSVTMDHWRYEEVVKMMEGGNRQLSTFFQRHALGRECSEFQSPQLTSENVATMRYKTKAALFYRQQLDRHVHHLLKHGPYKGRRRNVTKRRPLGTQQSSMDG